MKKCFLKLEVLEDRSVPSTMQPGWLDANRLSLSFAPDQTTVLNQTNQLFQTLEHLDLQIWQQEILRAFQSWAVHANINIGLVADKGLPFGSPGAIQGDGRFGDIRIGAVPQASGVLAVASSPDLFSGTWSGDVLLNSNVLFSLGGANDLFTTMLHEAGHVFGLEHDEDEHSALFAFASQVRTGLSAEDIYHIQELYGPRQDDVFEGTSGNNSLLTATDLAFSRSQTQSSIRMQALADITTFQDVDVYQFLSPANVQTLTVTLATAGLSLFQGQIQVYDDSGQLLASQSADGSFTKNLTVQLPSSASVQRFYIRVESATADVFGIGSYLVKVDMETNGKQNASSPTMPNLADGSNQTGAIRLTPEPGSADQTSYLGRAMLDSSSASRWFRVKAPNTQTGTFTTLQITVQVQDWLVWSPRILVHDHQGNPLSFEVLIQDDGLASIQLRDVSPNQDYLIEVTSVAGNPSSARFVLNADFQQGSVELTSFAVGTTTAEAQSHSLTVEESQLLSMLLDAAGESQPTAATQVYMTVRAGDGTALASLSTPVGGYRSGHVLLPAGSYSLEFVALDALGNPVTGVSYQLKGKIVSDPLEPQPEDVLLITVPPREPEPIDVPPLDELIVPVADDPVLIEEDLVLTEPDSDDLLEWQDPIELPSWDSLEPETEPIQTEPIQTEPISTEIVEVTAPMIEPEPEENWFFFITEPMATDDWTYSDEDWWEPDISLVMEPDPVETDEVRWEPDASLEPEPDPVETEVVEPTW
jgi:hypothetical protein